MAFFLIERFICVHTLKHTLLCHLVYYKTGLFSPKEAPLLTIRTKIKGTVGLFHVSDPEEMSIFYKLCLRGQQNIDILRAHVFPVSFSLQQLCFHLKIYTSCPVSCWIPHCVHQLFANCVWQLYGSSADIESYECGQDENEQGSCRLWNQNNGIKLQSADSEDMMLSTVPAWTITCK